MIRFPSLGGMYAALDELLVLALAGVVVWLIVRALQSNRARRPAPPTAQEAAPKDEDELLRRLCAQLDKMERRLDNLETILMDKDKTKKT